MIAFGFDQAKMRQRLTSHCAIFLGGVALLTFSGDLVLSQAREDWVRWLTLVLLYVVLMHTLVYARWVGILIRGLRRNTAAFLVNQNGIVDNASNYALGQLAWGEIEKMYPCDCNSHLLLNWWTRMPVISKQRGITVIVKDGIDLQHLVHGKPRLIRLLTRHWYASERGRWVFIPEMVLPITADELMRQLNHFYTTEVRGAA